MKDRINIGLLVDDLDNYFTAQCCCGAEIAAKELDANLYIIPGRYVGRPDGRYGSADYTYQYNTAYKLVSERNIDILYVLIGVICSRAEEDEIREFVASLPKVPTVFLFSNYEGYNTVNFDNKSGIREEVKHLYDKHGARKIGFVSGPLSNRDAQLRLEAFKEITETLGLAAFDCPIVYGDFTKDSEDVVNELLDEAPDLDAIVFANDRMAIGGYKVLYDRGLVPGEDILVMGFDDDVVAKSMIPPLSTVEANSADLTYQAVMNTGNYLSSQTPTDISTRTNLVFRKSCGCTDIDYGQMLKQFGLNVRDTHKENLKNAVSRYLFGVFYTTDSVDYIKDALDLFIDKYEEYIGDTSNDALQAEVCDMFFEFVKTDYEDYISAEKLFNALRMLQYRAYSMCDDDSIKLKISDLFSEVYRDIAFNNVRITQEVVDKRGELERLMNRQTGEITIDPTTDYINYKTLLTGITTMGISRMYLYFFQGSSKAGPKAYWRCPNTVLLKVYCDEDGTYEINEEQQFMRTERIFENDYIPEGSRHTMIATPVFIGDDIYGVLVSETECSNIAIVTPIAQQLSITVRSLIILDAQNKTRRELQASLEKFMNVNSMLDEIAKSDELTGLYNRRGFMTNADRIIKDPENLGQMALVCYADMDDLKEINDQYGHDDGDYALKETANILREAFRTKDVLGRMGGDEFVAFALVGAEGTEDAIKSRIERIMEEHDQVSDKPYKVSVCTGFHSFRCGPDVDLYELLDKADSRLYLAKQEKKQKNRE
ncbi:MAG: GGDEF domain-containing protein [Clostridiales bacterium]|nr:GGDEF domain-containing protein [Clostridiales bacterium]